MVCPVCVQQENYEESDSLDQVRGSYLTLLTYSNVFKGARKQIFAWQRNWHKDLYELQIFQNLTFLLRRLVYFSGSHTE